MRLGFNCEALIGVETGQNEESYTPKISSDLFRESNHNSLRDFFNEYEDEKRINATIDFIKTMRNYMSEQKYMDMSFGHDDEGTISIIMESSSSKSAPNDIEVVRFNPLDLSELDLESLDKYDLIMQNKEHLFVKYGLFLYFCTEMQSRWVRRKGTMWIRTSARLM